jgi:hypothetical protein
MESFFPGMESFFPGMEGFSTGKKATFERRSGILTGEDFPRA